jgi:hypothetical protein
LKRAREILFNQVKSGQLVSDQNKVTWNLIIKGVVSRDEGRPCKPQIWQILLTVVTIFLIIKIFLDMI